MKRHPLLLIIVIGLVAFPQQASANAGTPLMWAGMIHLLIGNALIGALEGFLLGSWFRLPRAKAIGVMIAANYASAWVGGVFVRGAIVEALPMDLTNGWRWFWVMLLVTYCLTIVLELPFTAWAFRGAQDWLKRSVRASFVVQSVSYVLLFGWYWTASGTSLYTRMQVVASEDLSLPESVLVYYIDSSDGHIYRRRFRDSGRQRVLELHSTDANDRLFVRPSAADTNLWDLMARLETEDRRIPKLVPVLTNLHVDVAPDWRRTHTDPPDYEGTSLSFGKVPAVGSATNSQWEFWAGFWAGQGLRASRKDTGERLRFSYETPFGAWAVRNAVLLPSDKVLFQLGDDQICGFDPVERRVALLWHGRGPVPLIEKGMSNQITPANAGIALWLHIGHDWPGRIPHGRMISQPSSFESLDKQQLHSLVRSTVLIGGGRSPETLG